MTCSANSEGITSVYNHQGTFIGEDFSVLGEQAGLRH